jgi:hypothetical protein
MYLALVRCKMSLISRRFLRGKNDNIMTRERVKTDLWKILGKKSHDTVFLVIAWFFSLKASYGLGRQYDLLLCWLLWSSWIERFADCYLTTYIPVFMRTDSVREKTSVPSCHTANSIRNISYHWFFKEAMSCNDVHYILICFFLPPGDNSTKNWQNLQLAEEGRIWNQDCFSTAKCATIQPARLRAASPAASLVQIVYVSVNISLWTSMQFWGFFVENF